MTKFDNPVVSGKTAGAISAVAIALSALLAAGCGDNSSDPVVETSTLPVAGSETGAFTIDTSGGNGGSGAGGTGGLGKSVNVTLYNGGGGRLEILKHGVTTATFTPTTVTTDLGSNPYTVSTSATINVVGTKPAAGTPYMVSGKPYLYLATASGTLGDAAEIVTGLSIATGVTLTLALNTTGSTTAELVFTDDIDNKGQITTLDAGAPQRGHLSLWAKNYIGSGTITTAGTTATFGDGGDVTLRADGGIYNSGAIDASGFDETSTAGTNGGTGGKVKLAAAGPLENSAAIDSSGGNTVATNLDGGAAGAISLDSDFGHIYNAGALTSVGGNGARRGQAGGAVSVGSNDVGELRNSGDITTSGGSGSADRGRNAGTISMMALGGALTNAGNLTANGGNGANGFNAGNGGNISVQTAWGKFETTPGHLLMSGNVSAKGGSASGNGAGLGGDGGALTISGNSAIGTNPFEYATQVLGLWGYTAVTAAGGTGQLGGDGGAVMMASESGDTTTYAANWGWVTSGNVVNEANVTTSGGNTTAATGPWLGGNGGNVTLTVTPAGVVDGSSVSNSGTIVTTTGQNLDATGANVSGAVILSASGGVTNSGAITTTGANDAGIANLNGSGFGNDAGSVDFLAASGSVASSAAITANGGNGETQGGLAGGVTMLGTSVANTGALTANGGASTQTALPSSKGGDGDDISLIAKNAGALSNSGTLANNGGSGGSAGAAAHQILLSGN